MSAIGGFYSRWGGPISHRFRPVLTAALNEMGPDGKSELSSEDVWMLFRPFHTERQSRLSYEPFVSHDGYLITCDGRLDSVDEPTLLATLQKQIVKRPLETIAATYRSFGIQGFSKLIGDFAFALWDSNQHRLILCSDFLGRRPLSFYLTRHYLAWASRARALAVC